MNARLKKKPWACRLLGHSWVERLGQTPVAGLDAGDLICTTCGVTKWSGS